MHQNHDCGIYSADVSPLAAPAVFDAALAQLPLWRREKVDRLRFPEGKRLSLGAGLLLNMALAQHHVDALSATVETSPLGKPFLPDYPDIHFNLSHSENRVLCVISDLRCGCDVERLGRGSFRLARRFYAEEEQERLTAADEQTAPAEWQALFARIWTRKESYLKADGRGFSVPPASFSVFSQPSEVVFLESDAAQGYHQSVCLLNPDGRPPRWQAYTVQFHLSAGRPVLSCLEDPSFILPGDGSV